ncbi:copper resistance CopC family protein [Leucobacter chromiireducens]|uniref:Copper resistance protein CopC n=1 Tax=Leucobacter chromiireducens subsp. chromiireducens TaxID=660067 RepID=A0ABS1SM95_9MICO|nr:copper resistance CopC family protein [Leucobacter chromiireducens]MBL3689296.1 copper resistance protein CopC [Leucobacter chromiireducens subsp. chromiireducens]
MSHTPASAARHRASLGLAAIALLAGATTLGVAAPALAHDELIGTEVVANASTGAVEAFELKFNNSIIEVGTEMVVTGPDGADASDGEPEIAGPVVTQKLSADLAPGDYSAAWRVVSSDGHPIEGAFGISVAEDGTGEIVAAAPAEESADHEHADETEAHEHGADHEHGTEDAQGADSAGLPVGGLIAIIGGAVVVIGGVTAAIVGRRRRAQGMAADTQNFTDTASTEGDTK